MRNKQFIFRIAEKRDADAIVQIEKICFPIEEQIPEQYLRERVELIPDFFLLAEDVETGKIAGSICGLATNKNQFDDCFFTDINSHEPNGKNVMLVGLAVLPEFQKQGLAKELMNQFAAFKKKSGHETFVLTCVESLVPMYEKFGFHDCGLAHSTWGGHAWHEMKREL